MGHGQKRIVFKSILIPRAVCLSIPSIFRLPVSVTNHLIKDTDMLLMELRFSVWPWGILRFATVDAKRNLLVTSEGRCSPNRSASL